MLWGFSGGAGKERAGAPGNVFTSAHPLFVLRDVRKNLEKNNIKARPPFAGRLEAITIQKKMVL